MKAICKTCNIDFNYTPSRSNGLFCSNACCGIFKKQSSVQKLKEGTLLTNSTIRIAFNTMGLNTCAICNQGTVWNDKPLVLQVDHIDGNSDNNKYNNLRLLCPNCHTQTSTFTSRNKKNTKRNKYLRQYKETYKQL